MALLCETSLKPLSHGQCFAILQDVRTRLNPVCVHMDNFTAAKQSISDKTVFKFICTDERVVVWYIWYTYRASQKVTFYSGTCLRWSLC